METFSALLAICAENSPVPGEFSSQRPVTRSFDVLSDWCLNKQLSKQSRRCHLRRHRAHFDVIVMVNTWSLEVHACLIDPIAKHFVIPWRQKYKIQIIFTCVLTSPNVPKRHFRNTWYFVYGFIMVKSLCHRGCGGTLRPRQDGRRHFQMQFLNEYIWISINISLKFVPKGPINKIPTLVQIMAWCRPGAKPLSKPMMMSLLTHICVTRPQWVKSNNSSLLQPLRCHH